MPAGPDRRNLCLQGQGCNGEADAAEEKRIHVLIIAGCSRDLSEMQRMRMLCQSHRRRNGGGGGGQPNNFRVTVYGI